MFILDLIPCGGVNIPEELIKVIKMVINFIYIGVPILLIIWGMLDLGKAVIQQKEDDIKKSQNTFFKRLIAAAIVFFVVVIVKFVVGIMPISDAESVTSCLNTIFN